MRRAVAEPLSGTSSLSVARDALQARLGLLLLAGEAERQGPIGLSPAHADAALRGQEDVLERLRLSEQLAHVRVEELERRAALRSAVSELLEVAPDALAESIPAVLGQLTALLVPTLADLARIDLLREDGTLEPTAVRAGWMPDGAPVVTIRAARGEGVVMADESGDLPRGVRSAAALPMRARGRTLGVLTLAATAPARGFRAEDLRLAEDVARSAAVALDNARLFGLARAETRCREQALAAVSHEMRSPLQVISIASGALLRAWPADAALLPERRQIAVIAQSADRMRRLAADLLDLSRVDAGNFSVSPEPVRVGVMLQGAAEVHRPAAEQKGITLAVSSFPARTAMLDEQRLHQVLANLVGNAVRFTPSGGTITLSAEVVEDEVRFTVTDTGAGIAPEHLPRVFDRFWSAGKCRDCAGLGLSISRAIVEAHGGTITVRSTVGEGTTFTVSLPHAEA
jgi:signal transduction histidine kinase